MCDCMTASYWLAARPKTVEHKHPFLVFDSQDRLHLPLTTFGKEACGRLDVKTVQTYLYSILPYFTWLDTDVWQIRTGQRWDVSPQQVRRSIDDYLVQKLQCQILPQRQGWKYIAITAGTKSTLRIFLAALKLFYQVMRERELYAFANPLVDSMSATIAAAVAHVAREEDEPAPPRMPDQSGVEAPRNRPKHRLTDSYYKLEHEEWRPQIIDDPQLPGYILKAGRKLSLKYTRLRDEVVTWLLFETGARVSEVCGLMLADWAVLGTKNKAKAFSKGSAGRRVKTISFAEDTVILLQRYFDEERVHFDPHGYQLDDYLLLGKQQQIDLFTIPLFLTSQGSQLTPKEYREHYWNPACQAAGIEADVHQSRHWHVTLEVRDIYETAKNTAEVERRLRGLIEYMKWKSEETLAAYEHYFTEQRDADARDDLHRRMHAEVQQYLVERHRGKPGKPALRKPADVSSSAHTVRQFSDEPDLSFLYSLAGEMCDGMEER
jgi:integrase